MQGNEGQQPERRRAGSRPDVGWAHRVRWIAKQIKAKLLEEGHPNECAICGAKGRLVVNHDTTGLVWGLLCERCDRALGLFEGSPELLRRAAAYRGRPPTRYIYGETAHLDLKPRRKGRGPKSK